MTRIRIFPRRDRDGVLYWTGRWDLPFGPEEGYTVLAYGTTPGAVLDNVAEQHREGRLCDCWHNPASKGCAAFGCLVH